ncbi:ROK family protein [Buttiauxella sp. WJP83]|uniref:ROK family protein n=1 Tax=Buttiauxella sp. WJP83 TaxID=2986951 RepID=UPI0022DD0200|nr:ROK family protein [Buttiauxella sp. WJP83]WBM72229.1 ROK family protein [Buttiauxella sp. WJP83]
MRLGLDIGGTKIEAVILGEQGDVIYRERYATPKQSYGAFFEAVVEVIGKAMGAVSGPLSVGLGIPGTVGSSGLIKNSNILVLNQQPFSRDLEQHLGMPVAVTNDANCFTLSEAMDGGGKGYGVVFGVILGTGCGGGLCVDNRLISGPNSCAGEWGHNALPHFQSTQDGQPVSCYCGQLNCIENFVSGSGLERQYFDATAQQASVPEIMQRIASGDDDSCRVWDRYRDQLARALASVVNTLDPDVIVLGGGISNIALLYPGLQEKVAQYVFGQQCCTPIIQAKHGDSSGVRGAAWLGAQLPLNIATA